MRTLLAAVLLCLGLSVTEPVKGEAGPAGGAATRAPASTSPSCPSRAVDRLLYAAGGALVGAWVGFFASHVRAGDWERAERPVNRVAWAASGSVVGAAASLTLTSGGSTCQQRVSQRMMEEAVVRGARRATTAADANGAGRGLRPLWPVRGSVGTWKPYSPETTDEPRHD